MHTKISTTKINVYAALTFLMCTVYYSLEIFYNLLYRTRGNIFKNMLEKIGGT